MDIYIKSFNRAYYLDRCLYSIKTYVSGDYNVYVLDDGTPQQYLKIIQEKYPEIVILKSGDYNLKSDLINKESYDKLPSRVPSSFWYKSVVKASDYIMVLEDDIWFTQAFDIKTIVKECKEANVAMLKMSWLGNEKLIACRKQLLQKNSIVYTPKLKFSNPILYNWIYCKYNRLWRVTLKFLGLYAEDSELNYYSIYSVAGAVFKKDYYLSVWKDAYYQVDEKQQILKALQFYHKNKVAYGRTVTEVLKTGFISSAFNKGADNNFSIHDFNTVLNNHWVCNDVLYLKNLNRDISMDLVKGVLKQSKKSNAYIHQWENWVSSFEQSFRAIGCKM